MCKTEMPWYVNFFSGIFAWISGCFFIAFLAAAHLLPAMNIYGLVTGILAVSLSTFLVRIETGPFLSQTSLALSVAGHFLVIGSVSRLFSVTAAIPLTSIILWVLLYIPTPSYVHRFFSTVLVWVTVTIYCFYYFGHETVYAIIALQFLATVLISLSNIKIRGSVISEVGKPAAFASILGGFILLLYLHTRWFQTMKLSLSIFFAAMTIALMGHSAGSIRQVLKVPHCYGTAGIILISLIAPPGLVGAIVAGILGFGTSNTLITGTGTLFLPVFLFLLYYDLQVTLMNKSLILIASGSLILLIRKLVIPDSADNNGSDNEINKDESYPVKQNTKMAAKIYPAIDTLKKNPVLTGTFVVILTVINLMIINKEQILKYNESIYLKLAPIDPRSLMQGDYMLLRYDIADKLNKILDENNHNGKIVITTDKNHVATFVRIDNGQKLTEKERLLTYKYRAGQIKFGAESYFFQEGQRKIYESAAYGELKITKSGRTLLVGLRDKDYKLLTPSIQKADG